MDHKVNPLLIEWDLIPFDWNKLYRVDQDTAACHLPDTPGITRYTARITLYFNDDVIAHIIAKGSYKQIKSLKKRLVAGQEWSTVCTWYFDGVQERSTHGQTDPG